jgi:outer membrane autotransporter protein
MGDLAIITIARKLPRQDRSRALVDAIVEAAALTVGNLDRESLRSNAGIRIGADFEVGRVTVRPQLRGSWYHEFRDRAQVITAGFINPGLSTTPFRFVATINIAGYGPISMVADYNVQVAKDRQLHAFTVGARLAF